ncbi:MAG: hypothetical protein NUV75_01850 [Gallionella sp.]|nr:hypothetical protein [Gallionella sp.]
MTMIYKPDNTPALTRKTATKYAPAGTSVVVKVTGGYAAFHSRAEYQTWCNQK